MTYLRPAIRVEDIITGEKFKGLAQQTYKYYDSKNNLAGWNDSPIYSDTETAVELLSLHNLTTIATTFIFHNSDEKFCTNVSKSGTVFTQNLAVPHSYNLHAIPIGLENNRWFPELRKKEKLLSVQGPAIRLAYLNCNINTNRAEREPLYELFKDAEFVTLKHCLNGFGFDQYISALTDHHFVISPEGNGLDCHRTWEALYAGRIPIIKRNHHTYMYEDLPVLIIDSWDQITKELLLRTLSDFRRRKFKLCKLYFRYWQEKILGSSHE